MAQPLINKTKSGIPLKEIELALTEGAKCGMGIDFKRGLITLPNYNSVSGDVDGYSAIYVVNGAIEIGTIAEALAAIGGYCTNSNVTATSVVMTGCLADTDLIVLATRQLTATVLPSGATQTGTWTTSDALVATVSVAGLVTGVAAGTATITFTSTDGGFTATCIVTVAEA